MAATDFPIQGYARLWTLLLAHAPWTAIFKPANRIRLDVTDVRNPLPNMGNDSDFPRATLYLPTFSDSLFTLERHYGHTHSFNIATMPWVEDLNLTYVLNLVHSDIRLGVAHVSIMETLTAIRKGGPALGWNITQGQVMQVGPVQPQTQVQGSQTDPFGNPSGTLRLVTNIQIPVLLRLKSSQLIM